MLCRAFGRFFVNEADQSCQIGEDRRVHTEEQDFLFLSKLLLVVSQDVGLVMTMVGHQQLSNGLLLAVAC